MFSRFSDFFIQYTEANILPFNRKWPHKNIYPDNYPPLKDTDSIRVYHGSNNIVGILRMLKYGVSGKERADRIYSYETNNNPRGLFVSISPEVAKDFGHFVIEFHTKVSDLESPVWPGNGYTVQGQMAQYFSDDNEREQKRLSEREKQKHSTYDSIRNSDRPELAAILFQGGEAQALFTGELDPNSIKYVWANDNENISTKWSSFTRYTRKDFIKKYGHRSKVLKTTYKGTQEVDDDHRSTRRVLKPREKFDIELLLHRINQQYKKPEHHLTMEELKDALAHADDGTLLMYVWPSQLQDAKNAFSK